MYFPCNTVVRENHVALFLFHPVKQVIVSGVYRISYLAGEAPVLWLLLEFFSVGLCPFSNRVIYTVVLSYEACNEVGIHIC